MEFPELITRLPLADVPFPGVDGHMLRSADGLVVFFHFRVATTVPPHAHGAQWGTVVDGTLELTIGGETRLYRPGDSYTIRAGELHSAHIPAGTKLVEFFAEPDRYRARP
ncbi:MAG: cupin domain-containing protein [Anaerolineae bacterium]|nr:cupin domain-containing protein [Anaerolineae bacterium]